MSKEGLIPPRLGIGRLLSLTGRTVISDLQHRGRPAKSDAFASSSGPRQGLDRIVFVVGAPRSGTTFLGRCLADVPGLSYHFEPALIKAAVPYVYLDLWPRTRAERYFTRAYRLLGALNRKGGPRMVEKTPQNAMIVPFLAETFPDAQFLHIIRDGRDAALSWSKKPWLQEAMTNSGKREPGGYRYGAHPRFWVEPDRADEFRETSDIHRCIWGWRRHVEHAMDAGRKLPSGRYFEIRYEDLMFSTADVADDLFQFLGWPAASVDEFMKYGARARSDSIGNWRKEVTRGAEEAFESEAGQLLRALGY